MFQPSPSQSSGPPGNAGAMHRPRELRDRASRLSAFSDVQFARIESLKRRIAAGSYQVPAAAVAERLMAHMAASY